MPISFSSIAQCNGLKQPIRLALIASIVLNLSFLVVLFTPLTAQLYKPLIVNEKPLRGDVIVVLSAGAYDSGLPDFSTLVRLRKGLELYQQKYAHKIICSGGTKLGNINKSIARVMKDTLILYGIPAADILIQDETINTYNDISYLIDKFKGGFDFNKSIFVTSSYHTFRVKQVLQKKNIKAQVVSAEPYQLTPRVWSEKLDLLREVGREYLAICYFKLAGYI